MSTDALVALLEEVPNARFAVQAEWLRARGVVVLPADHPLRTGQPSETMIEAARLASIHPIEADEDYGDVLLPRPATTRALRAALAVLREER